MRGGGGRFSCRTTSKIPSCVTYANKMINLQKEASAWGLQLAMSNMLAVGWANVWCSISLNILKVYASIELIQEGQFRQIECAWVCFVWFNGSGLSFDFRRVCIQRRPFFRWTKFMQMLWRFYWNICAKQLFSSRNHASWKIVNILRCFAKIYNILRATTTIVNKRMRGINWWLTHIYATLNAPLYVHTTDCKYISEFAQRTTSTFAETAFSPS